MKQPKTKILSELDTSMKLRTKNKVKNYLIGILAAALILTWAGPFIGDLSVTGSAVSVNLEEKCEDSGGGWNQQEEKCLCPQGYLEQENICVK